MLLSCGITLSPQLDIPKDAFPCASFFVDSSEVSALLMNQSESGVEICPNFTWLGRSGIKEINGIRIAFVSGIDSDILGSEV